LTVLGLSATGLALSEVPELVEQLRKFPALKQLDVSANPALRLLPVGLLRIAADLDAFNCDGCSLLLPPQSFFSTTPDENPSRVRQLLQGGAINLSGALPTPTAACEVAAVLVHYPALKQLDVSGNPALDRAAVSAIVRAVSGTAATQHSRFTDASTFHFPHVFRVLLLMRV
jgi:hypothetical protein